MNRSAAAVETAVNVTELVERGPFGPLHVRAFVLCLLCLLLDGFDVQALGYTAPSIVRDWGVPNAALGPVFAAANFGVLLGALFFSMLADRIGRRPVLVVGTLLFAVMMILTARVTSVPQLLVMRLLTGIGLGTIIPNASALIGEYSPRRLRASMIMIAGAGFTGGAAIGGFIAAALIPAYGWQAVFYFGGAIPVVLGVLMIVGLPESLQFMVIRGHNPRVLASMVNQIDPRLHASPASEFVIREERVHGVPVLHLFREGRAVATLLFWVVNFMNLLNLYSLASWLPTVVRDAGYSAATAVLVGTVLQVGGTLGTIGLAWIVPRRGFVPVLGLTFAVACAGIALIGQPGLSLPLIYVVVFVAGWCVVGSQPALNALSGTYYPTAMRSTGVGAGLGIGRIGAIVGPAIGGYFMGAHWATRDMFLAAAVPAFISAIAMLSLRWVVGPRMGITRSR